MEHFVVYKNEIEGRLDPFYYRPEFQNFDEKLSKLKIRQIKEIAKVICGPFGSSITVKDYTRKGVPLIRISNIEEDHLTKKDVVYISEELAKNLKSYVVKEGDLIISQRGTLGLAVKVSKDFDGSIISANFIAIKEIKGVLPDFLQIILSSKLGQIQLLRKTSGQIQAKVTTDDIKTIRIPIPPFQTQQKIITKIKQAYKLKKSKETQAQKLLSSIKDYILSELGIKLPEIKDQITFVAYADEVKGKRLDAYYYQPKFEKVEKAIEQGIYNVKELKDSFDNGLIKGTLPKESEKNGEVKVLQIKNLLKNGLIDISEYLTSKNIFKPEQKINKGDIIIVITGATIGKVGLWYLDDEFYLGGDMIKFTPKKYFNPNYIHSFLLSQAGQFQILKNITGATNKHLSPSDVEKIKIPLPPLEVQNKIAEEVRKRMQKALQLQREAKEILERAKQEVENILLNGENYEN